MLLCGRKHGLEFGIESIIGERFRMLHPYNITVSGNAKIGDYCTMLKGSTVGVVPGTCDTWGAPTIGNHVYIGLNASVIGKISIGDDVLIAPNTLVNRDVPSHSVVIGCPMKVIHREHATQFYYSEE